MARPQKCRCICSIPKTLEFIPAGDTDHGEVRLAFDEYEALRLLDVEKKSQAQCAARMNVSRTTVTRIYEKAREKIGDALVNGKRIVIGGGDVILCKERKPECMNEKHCCHRTEEGSGQGYKEEQK